jgi:hypothetical protein
LVYVGATYQVLPTHSSTTIIYYYNLLSTII